MIKEEILDSVSLSNKNKLYFLFNGINIKIILKYFINSLMKMLYKITEYRIKLLNIE